MSTKFILILAVAIGACLSGCGAQDAKMYSASKDSSFEMASAAEEIESDATNLIQTSRTSGSHDNTAALNRKIIYNTSVGLVVEDYTSFENELPNLVESHGGFVASSHTNRRYNDSQSGQWVLRVPVLQYSDLLGGLNALGFAESRSENAQDVTEEFVDIEARIKNKKALEVRVIAILEDRSGKLSEVLEIERELSRVREEIERMEGRLRFLRERSSLATITINCREEQEYQPAAAPTFASRISSAFVGSMTTLQRGVADLVVATVALLPWIMLITLALWLTRKWLFHARDVVLNRAPNP